MRKLLACFLLLTFCFSLASAHIKPADTTQQDVPIKTEKVAGSIYVTIYQDYSVKMKNK